MNTAIKQTENPEAKYATPAELQLAMASLLLIPQLANLRPSLVSFAPPKLLLYPQGKELKEHK